MSDMRSKEDRRKADRRIERKPKDEPIAIERRKSEQRDGEDRRS